MRLAVYADFAYRRDADGALYADEAFVLFMAALKPATTRLVFVGRLEPEPGRGHYRIDPEIELLGLPHYADLAVAGPAVRGMAGALRRFWRLLDEVDAVWLLGPHPLTIAFAALGLLRRRRVVLGVRQHFPDYIRRRRPGRRDLLAAALVLEGAFRLLGRAVPVVAVGPELARGYVRGAPVLEASVSLVRADALTTEGPRVPDADAGFTALSVGRLDPEKNPVLLADILARLRAGGSPWRLVVCGDGPSRCALEQRLAELEVAEYVDLRGYVPVDAGLQELYRTADALLHVSWTEGFPQVLVEAFGARLPVVATAVGGVPRVAGDAALLVAPGDADAAARALERVVGDVALRRRLADAGSAVARGQTLEAASRRVADFIAGASAPAARS
ncbi:MAG TPA: glycosyltransferase [Solirubrobacteraceae bacterium]|nr:glycosyltransferase [Solirubrobacteraceae bacterium]